MPRRHRVTLTIAAGALGAAVLVVPRAHDAFRQHPACQDHGQQVLAAHGFTGEPDVRMITDDGRPWTSFGHHCSVHLPDGTVVRFTD